MQSLIKFELDLRGPPINWFYT